MLQKKDWFNYSSDGINRTFNRLEIVLLNIMRIEKSGQVFETYNKTKYLTSEDKQLIWEKIFRCTLYEIFFNLKIWHDPKFNLKLKEIADEDREYSIGPSHQIQVLSKENKNYFHLLEYEYLSRKNEGFDYQIKYLIRFFLNLRYRELDELFDLSLVKIIRIQCSREYYKPIFAEVYIQKLETLGFSYSEYELYVKECILRGGFSAEEIDNDNSKIGWYPSRSYPNNACADDEDSIMNALQKGDADKYGF